MVWRRRTALSTTLAQGSTTLSQGPTGSAPGTASVQNAPVGRFVYLETSREGRPQASPRAQVWNWLSFGGQMRL